MKTLLGNYILSYAVIPW